MQFQPLFPASESSIADNVVVHRAHEAAPLSTDYRLDVNGLLVPVYQTCSRYGSDISFAYVSLEPGAIAAFAVHVLFAEPGRIDVLPQRVGLDAQLSESTARFEVGDPETYLTLVVDGDYRNRPLHLFVNGPDRWDAAPDDPDVLYFGPGYYEFPFGYAIELESNQTLYLAAGAWVNAPVLVKAGSRNVHVCGHGILAPDQLGDTRRVRGLQVDPGCSNVRIEGIIMNKRVTGWCGILIHSQNIEVEHYKVVTGSIWSTDGMNPVNSQHVRIRNCFIRCGDDTVAVKGFRSFSTRNLPEDDPAESPPNEDIVVESCILWSDNNNALVLGQETKASEYRDIHVRNCDILFVNDASDRQGALSMICLDGTHYSDISFEDIRIGVVQRNIINVFFTEEIFDIPGSQRWNGSMRDVVFRNISVEQPGDYQIRILGWDERNLIDGMTLANITVGGTAVTADGPPRFVTNEFARNVRFLGPGGSR